MVNTKKIRKLMIAVLAFLICSILVVPVFAASTHDSGSGAVTVDNYMLDFSWETTYEKADASQSGDNNGGSGSVSLSSNVFTLAAKSSYYRGASIVNWTQDIVYNYTTRLTITNNGTKGCTVTYTTSGITEPSGSVTLGPGDAVSFTLATTTEKTSTKAQNLSGTVTITKVEAVSAMPIGFESSAYGSYSYAIGTDEAVTMAAGEASVSSNVESGTTITLTAGTPTNGYAFYGWMGAGKLLSTSNPYTHTASIETSIYPVFLPSDIIAAGAPFSVGGNSHMFWHLACADAVISGKPVVLAKDYTLPTNLNNNGLYEGHAYSAYITGEDGAINYIIPSGVTFLVPCDTANTVYTTVPGIEGPDTYSQPATYRTLTMASGAHITVNGAMSIAGYQGTKMPFNGCVSKSVGFVKMNSGSAITVNNGAFLYAWGYVTGSGSVTAKSGATVYESFQVTDWRGGNAASGMANNKQKVFPLSQYYIQNIEVPLTLEAGAKEYGYMTISYTGLLGGAETAGSPVPVVGSDGLFRISSGSLTKDYDEANDRIIFTITGNSSLASMSLSVKASLGITVNIKSANYVLPLNSNATVNCPSGSTITVTEDMALLPGVQVNIAEGGTVKLDKGVSMYIYDGDNWGNYIGSANLKLVTLPYAPGKASGVTRTEADLVDVKFCVDGILDASEGYLYTTAAGANIYSTGAGTVESNPGSETVTYQATQTGNEITAWPTIPITPAQLKNSDGTYATTGASTVTPNTYTYTNGKWVCENHTYQMTSTTATCTQAGTSVYTCSVCGATKKEEQEALDHIDENNDHSCDRNCGKTDMGTHAAAEGKHTCDYCGETVTQCADGDKDHDCDVCGTKLTDCADTDSDHNCDICGTKLSDCADNDNNHKCDVCSAVLSECADTDNNHNCDVCGTKLSDCADNDNNHKCDVCSAVLSECADTDNNHNCDVCGSELSECADTDNDHNCDVCGEELSQCVDTDNNHNCDVCGDKLSECADTDNDHNCDVCGDRLSDCADNDKDHNCDVCGTKLSDCADDNSDHNCDICGEELSQCADTDNDHNCDICGDKLSDCADNDKDHHCDVCGEELSECADDNSDHNCDVCGDKLSKCADTDKDHNCDVCGDKLSDCADNNKDHNCDVCDKELSECADTDNDHNCDICGDKLSDCADKNSDHNCDVCGTKLSECAEGAVVVENEVAATCTATGSYDNVVKCSVCGEELSRETVTVDKIEHSFTDYTYDSETGKATASCDYGCDTTDTKDVTLPDATVENLGKITVGPDGDYSFDGSYYVYDLIGGSSLKTATDPFDMTITMEFIANDSAEEAAANFFGNYTTDFYITMSGIKNSSFVGDGCYLAGYYPSFGAWVKIPLDGFTVENGKVYPVITSAGFNFKYVDICSSVQDFICGIYIAPEILEANPDMSVNLALGLSENLEAAQAANSFVTVDDYTYNTNDLHVHRYGTEWKYDKTGHWHECSCGDKTAVENHDYTESVTTQPGCETVGEKTFTCDCGYSYTEEIPAKGHTEETIPGKEATCTEDGLTDGVKCSVCGTVITAQQTIPTTGHNYVDGTCTVCGDKESTPEVDQNKYSWGQNIAIGLIEPWFMRANAKATVKETGTVVDYGTLKDYGIYFVRANDLTNPDVEQGNLSVEEILSNENTVLISKANGAFHDGSDANEGYFSARYAEGIYTYELDESIYVLAYITEADGSTYYAPVRERNLLEELIKRKDEDRYRPTERVVYAAMVELYESTVARRDGQDVTIYEFKATLMKDYGELNVATSTPYTFSHNQQVLLIEPWGIRFNCQIKEAGSIIDYSDVLDYGAVIFYDTDNTVNGDMTLNDLLSNQDAYVMSKSNGGAFVASVPGKTGNYIGVRYNNEIYTYQMDSNAYIAFFVKDNAGYHFGDVKVRNILNVMTDGAKNGNETEKAVVEDMNNLNAAIIEHRKAVLGE